MNNEWFNSSLNPIETLRGTIASCITAIIIICLYHCVLFAEEKKSEKLQKSGNNWINVPQNVIVKDSTVDR